MKKLLLFLLILCAAVIIWNRPALAEEQDSSGEGKPVTVNRLGSINEDQSGAPVVGSDGIAHAKVKYLNAKTVSGFSKEQQANYERLCDMAAEASEGEIEYSNIEIIKNSEGIPELRCYLPFRKLLGSSISGKIISFDSAVNSGADQSGDTEYFDRVEHFYERLSENQRNYFKCAIAAAKKEKASFATDIYTSDYTDLFIAFSAAYIVCPEYYEWLDNGGNAFSTMTISADGKKFHYGLTLPKSRYYSRSLEAKARKKINSLVKAARKYAIRNYPNDIDYGMLVYFDQWISKHTYYDYRGMDFAVADKACYYYCHSSYGTLLKGYGVCESYARTMSRLMDAAGITNCFVVGEGGSPGNVGGHAWNYVYLKNKWYMLDSTWDTPVENSAKIKYGSTREFFLIGTEEEKAYGSVHIADGQVFIGIPVPYFPTLTEHRYEYTEEENETAFDNAA